MRIRRVGLVVVAMSLVLAACEIQHIAPQGEGELRYRDEVFDDLEVHSTNDPGSSGNPGYDSSVLGAVSVSGAALWNPGPGDAPALLIHGTEDTVVPYSWAQQTYADAQAAGMPVYMTSWEGTGHVPIGHRADEIIEQSANFLYWALLLFLT